MRLRALAIALAGAGAAASLGFAAEPPSGQGPPQHCRRFNLRGTLTAVSDTSFSMKRAGAAAPITVRLTPSTETFWTGKGTLAGPAPGEWVWAKGQKCGDVYTAIWVLVRPRAGH
jgi:hypothetical protein